MCGGVARGRGYRDAGLHCTAVLHGLEAGARVYYRYGSAMDGWSPEASFVAPLSSQPPLPPRLQSHPRLHYRLLTLCPLWPVVSVYVCMYV